MNIAVNSHACPQNHFCPAVRACPLGAIDQLGVGAPRIDEKKCTRCGRCVNICPTGAIKMS